jgi:hypothetical protein
MRAWQCRQRSWLVVEPLPGYAPSSTRSGAVVHRGQQVDLAAVASGAAERLAVDGHRPPPAGSDKTGVPIPVGQPGAGHERRWR